MGMHQGAEAKGDQGGTDAKRGEHVRLHIS